jgi:hypothetical protein
MVWAPYLDLHTGAVGRIETFNFVFHRHTKGPKRKRQAPVDRDLGQKQDIHDSVASGIAPNVKKKFQEVSFVEKICVPSFKGYQIYYGTPRLKQLD